MDTTAYHWDLYIINKTVKEINTLNGIAEAHQSDVSSQSNVSK
jgi:hypothetical protein